MARTRKTDIPKYDPFSPSLDNLFISETDCFGKLWDLQNIDCSVCSYHVVCGELFKVNLNKRVLDKTEEERYLDSLRPLTVQQEQKIASAVTRCIQRGDSITMADIEAIFMEKMLAKDRRLVVNAVMIFIETYLDESIKNQII